MMLTTGIEIYVVVDMEIDVVVAVTTTSASGIERASLWPGDHE